MSEHIPSPAYHWRRGFGLILDALDQDVRFALRGMARSPGIMAIIVLTIALGVGANAAMFAVLDRLLFRQPAGVASAGEVSRIYSYGRANRGPVHYSDWFSVPDLEGMRAAMRGVADVEGYYQDDGWLIDGDSLHVQNTRVTPGYFNMLGVRPERGRFFAADEMRYGDPRYLVVLSDALWRSRFGADPTIVGRRIRVAAYRDTTTFTVVGVAQPAFAGVDIDGDDMWIPITARPNAGEGGGAWWTQRGFWIASLIMRVPAGTDIRSVNARLTMAYRQVNATGESWFDNQTRAVTAPLIQARGPSASDAGDRNVAVATRLGAMALIVLLLAAANAAALLLMRSLRRRREIGVRVALGISRQRLMTQLAVEVIIIGCLSGAAGLLMAAVTGSLLRSLLFTSVHWAPGVIDTRMVVFVAVLALTAAAASGLAPLAILGRRDLTDVLKAGSYEAGYPGSRLRSGLLIAQAAMCVALLASAGVFIQSLRRAIHLDLGYDASHLVEIMASAYGTNPPTAGIDAAADRLRALPMVTSLSRTLGGGAMASTFRLAGQDSIAAMQAPRLDPVDAAWFATTGAHVIAGRAITDEDVRSGTLIAVVNSAMAEHFWPGRSPLGECFFAMATSCRRVVGVIADFRDDLTAPPEPYYVIPMTRALDRPPRPILLRLDRPATPQDAALIKSIALPLIGNTIGQIAVFRLGAGLEREVHPWRVAGTLFTIFGLLALISASAGVYGLVSYDVGRRTREIGVRTAFGATPGRVIGAVLGPTLRVLVIGVGAGLVLAVLSGHLLAALLFETSPYDPVALLLTTATLLVVALTASLVPAWRATQIDPAAVLRSE